MSSGYEVAVSIELETKLPFLKPNWYFGLLFDEGWAFSVVQGREFTDINPYPLGAIAALGNLSDYTAIEEIGRVSPRRFTEPQKEELIYQYFWGIMPPKLRVYTQYPPRADLRVLIERLSITGDIGYLNGYDSPYYSPSASTEIWGVKEAYPQFQVYNPTNDAVANGLMRLVYCKYTYRWVKDQALIKDLVEDRRRVHKFIMGPPESRMAAPDWLEKAVGADSLKYSKEVAGL